MWIEPNECQEIIRRTGASGTLILGGKEVSKKSPKGVKQRSGTKGLTF